MKKKRVGVEVSIAVSEAVKAAAVDVISAYPITPQTHIVEELSQIVADAELDADFLMVESEQTAMAACIGAAAVGARTFTSTCSQGLQLMSEIVFIASSMRMPIVMAVANRALSGPISIWSDHSDVMANRDCGWIQFFVENGQEAHDHILIAYRVAEDHQVLLPAMVNLDGFILTHVIEPIEVLSRDEVGSYIPEYVPLQRLDPHRPITMGTASIPAVYTEAKVQEDVVLRNSKSVVERAWKEFAKRFGREYHAIESYKADDAEIILVTMGGISETAREAINKMRKDRMKVGLVRIRLWRPFPFEDFRKAVKNASVIVVADRSLSTGGPGGPVCSEIKACLYGMENPPYVAGFVIGLGGRDVRVSSFEDIVKRASALAEKGKPAEFEFVGVRE